MALIQISSVSCLFTFAADGAGANAVVDCYQYIASDKSLASHTPTGVFVARDSAGNNVPATLSGTIVTLSWITAPAAGSITVTILLEF